MSSGMNINDFSHLLDKHYAEDAKRQEEEKAAAVLEIAGVARRFWREIRAGLFEEGVPSDLVDDVTASFIRMITKGSE